MELEMLPGFYDKRKYSGMDEATFADLYIFGNGLDFIIFI